MLALSTTWFYYSLRTEDKANGCWLASKQAKAQASRCSEDREEKGKVCVYHTQRERIAGMQGKIGSKPICTLHTHGRTARIETAPVTSSPLNPALVLQSCLTHSIPFLLVLTFRLPCCSYVLVLECSRRQCSTVEVLVCLSSHV